MDRDGLGQHLYIDVPVRCPFNTTGFYHALRPRFQAAKGEKDKFTTDLAPDLAPVATHCILIPFATMET